MPNIWEALSLLGGGLQGVNAAEEEAYRRQQEALQNAIRERAQALAEKQYDLALKELEQRALTDSERNRIAEGYLALAQQSAAAEAADRQRQWYYDTGPARNADGSINLETKAGQELWQRTQQSVPGYMMAGGKPTAMPVTMEQQFRGMLKMATKPPQQEPTLRLAQPEELPPLKAEEPRRPMKLQPETPVTEMRLQQPAERPVRTYEEMVTNLPAGAYVDENGIIRAMTPAQKLALEATKINLDTARAEAARATAEAKKAGVEAKVAEVTLPYALTARTAEEIMKAVTANAAAKYTPIEMQERVNEIVEKTRSVKLNNDLVEQTMPALVTTAYAEALYALARPELERERLKLDYEKLGLDKEALLLQAKRIANDFLLGQRELDLKETELSDLMAIKLLELAVTKGVADKATGSQGTTGGTQQQGGRPPLASPPVP